MNRDQLEGNWKQMVGEVHRQWGKLTKDDIEVIKGDHEQLVGRVQERYGVAVEEAQDQVNRFVRQMEDWSKGAHDVAIEGEPVTTETLKIGM